jgi:hypothetical protein
MAERIDLDRPTTERSSERIRQDIAASRENISKTVGKLEERINQKLDWRQYAAEYPYVTLGAAAGIGLLASAIFRRRPSARERMFEAFADTVEDITESLADRVEHVITRRVGGGRMIKLAVAGMLTKAATDFIRDKIDETFLNRPMPAGSGTTMGANNRRYPDFDPKPETPSASRTES